jgi:hypothetical protein
MTEKLDQWMRGYRRAWESNDPADIGALFTDTALYFNDPFTAPARGREAIIANWIERADAPGETVFTWSPVIVTRELAIVQGETTYPLVRYNNLWVIRLDDSGRATEFTEWWMDQSRPSEA